MPLADILITTVVNSFNREVLEAKIFGEELFDGFELPLVDAERCDAVVDEFELDVCAAVLLVLVVVAAAIVDEDRA